MKVARVQLSELKDIVSESEFVYTSLADRVASELLSAAVKIYNYHAKRNTESAEIASASLTLVEYADEVACSSTTRARAQENLETLKSIVKNQAMKRVRTALETWMEDAIIQFEAYSSAHSRVVFVQQALGRSGSRQDSVIFLLTAFRNQGVRLFGPRFLSDRDMVQCATIVCGILARYAISAYNDADQQYVERKAAESLLAVNQHFGAISQQRNGDDKSFPITDESAAHLASNVATAKANVEMAKVVAEVKQLTRTKAAVTKTPVEVTKSNNTGCAMIIVFLMGMIALLASITVGLSI